MGETLSKAGSMKTTSSTETANKRSIYLENRQLAHMKLKSKLESSRKSSIIQRASQIRSSIDFGNRRKKEELADMRMSKYLLDRNGEPYIMTQLIAVQHIVLAWHNHKARTNHTK